MATVNSPKTEARLTRQAIDLMNCLAHGVEDVVYEKAKGLAAERTTGDSLQIDADDVREAAALIIEGLSKQLPENHPLAHGLKGMLQCVQTKCDTLMSNRTAR